MFIFRSFRIPRYFVYYFFFILHPYSNVEWAHTQLQTHLSQFVIDLHEQSLDYRLKLIYLHIVHIRMFFDVFPRWSLLTTHTRTWHLAHTKIYVPTCVIWKIVCSNGKSIEFSILTLKQWNCLQENFNLFSNAWHQILINRQWHAHITRNILTQLAIN